MGFGDVSFENVLIDSSFKNAEVNIDNFTCEYKHLSGFENVVVANKLVVSGELAKEESIVELQNLYATIDSDVDFFLGDQYIEIGKTKMHSDGLNVSFDIGLSFEPSDKNVRFNKLDGR